MILFFLKSLISKKIYEVNPSLIIADSVHPLGALTGLWFSIVKKCPFVYQIRDIWPLALVTEGKLSKINPIYWLFEIIQNICLKKCAFVLSSLKYYNKFLKEKKVFKKVVWIPNPIKKTNYKKLYHKAKTVLYIGGFGVAHDVETVLKGILCFQKKYSNKAKFLFIGNGVRRVGAEQTAKKYKLKNITFLNYQRKEELKPILQKSHIGIAALYSNPIYNYGVNLNKINSYFSYSMPTILTGGSNDNELKTQKIGAIIPSRNPFLLAETIQMFLNLTPNKYNSLTKKIRQYAKKTRNLKKLQSKLLYHIHALKAFQ